MTSSARARRSSPRPSMCSEVLAPIVAGERRAPHRSGMEEETSGPREPLWEELDAFASEPIPSFEPPPDVTQADFADPPRTANPAEANPEERILAALGATPAALDEIVRGSGLPASLVRATLLELELAGRVARAGGDLVQLLR